MTETPAKLAALKVAELHTIAGELGIDSAKLRKGELVDAIVTARGGTSALTAAPAESAAAEVAPAHSEGGDAAGDAGESSGRSRRSRRASTGSAGVRGQQAEATDADAPAETPAEAADGESDENQGERGRGRGRGRRSRGGNSSGNASSNNSNGNAASTNGNTNAAQNDDSTGDDENREDGGRNRNRRDRNRRRSDDLEPEILDDDVLLPIAGILDVLDNYAFVRTTGYLPGPSDVYVSLGQVKKYHLRKGDAVVGAVKAPREGESNSRQKYNALVSVDSVNGKSVEESGARTEFIGFTPVAPFERLRLETERNQLDTRLVDLFAPLGKGQRAIISGGAQTGKSTLLHQMAAAVSVNHPDAHLMVVLVDERPEVVTEASRLVKGEVVASTFDRNPEDHITVAELAIERAKRLVELGHDVVVLLDSLSALTRAYQAHAAAGNRMFSNANDPAALFAVKKLLGAARKVENGGSLTLIATASENDVERAALEEFRNAANAEVRLSGALAASRTFPAIDVNGSASRTERDVLSADEVRILGGLRRELSAHAEAAALQSVISGLVESATNVEFLLGVQRKHGA